MKKYITTIFWILVINFIFILAQIFVEPITEIFRGPIFLLPFATLFLLGVVLLIMVYKSETEKKLKKTLLLVGVSACGVLISTILHNVFYALAEVTKNIIILTNLMEIFHVIFFLGGVIIFPIGFLVGMIGSVILLIKQRKQKS